MYCAKESRCIAQRKADVLREGKRMYCASCHLHQGPHSSLITGFVAIVKQRMTLVEQELLTLVKHRSSPSVFSSVRVALSFIFCVVFCNLSCPFVPFLLAIVLYLQILIYSFDIFKLFMREKNGKC